MTKEHIYYVHILASKKDGVLYTGVTNDLIRRVFEHKNKLIEGFTQKYYVDKLVYYESGGSIEGAISREKCIKRWKRDWKVKLINENNPDWNDLYFELLGK